MRKIMLVIDEYQEMVMLENLLRRIGFDVLSVGKDILVNDALFRFTPEIVIATTKGRSVDGMKVATRMKKISPPPRVALTYALGNAPNLEADSQAIVDAMLVTPIQPATVLKIIAQLAGLDPGPLLSKYQKISAQKGQGVESVKVDGDAHVQPETSRFVRSTPQPLQPTAMDDDPWGKAELEWDPSKTPGAAATSRSARSDRYDRFLSDNDVGEVNGVLPRDKALAAMKKLKLDSVADADLIAEIDAEKRAFVTALFEQMEQAEMATAEKSSSGAPAKKASR